MLHTRNQIEDAILAALEPLKASHGVRTLDGYDLRLEDEEAWRELAIQFPAVFVAYSSTKYRDLGQRQLAQHRYKIAVADQSFRKRGAKRGGLGGGGTNDLVDVVERSLTGLVVLPDMTPIMPEDVMPVMMNKYAAMYAVTITLGQGFLVP